MLVKEGEQVTRPRLLDLFCGAGGAAVGYHRAGFDVVGVDIRPQPHYPFEFLHDDALRYMRDSNWALRRHLGMYDAIHASPPCQAFTAYRRKGHGVGDGYPDLIAPLRDLLDETGLPYVIENVPDAPLHPDSVMICGSMFDPPMDIRRERLFETNWKLEPPIWPCRHLLTGVDRFPGGRSKDRTGTSRGLVRGTMEIGTWDIALEEQQAAMGIDWMTLEELSESIPPAYTEFIGEQLVRHVREASSASVS